MKLALFVLLAAVVSAGTACGSAPPSAGVPSLGGGTAVVGASHASRAAALHAAAQCIREHGVPTYQDPALSADGHVYTDARSIEDLDAAAAKGGATGRSPVLVAIRQSCGTMMAAAGFQPTDEAPAPPRLVQAGVRAAECLRAHGLPSFRDPTAASVFTPGHGFAISGDELPSNGALGKQDPTFQRATTACRALIDEEIRQSDLANLASD